MAPILAPCSTIWHEGDNGQGDAGSLPSSANITTGYGALTDIIGSVSDATAGADMYEIYILDPLSFSVTTAGNGSKPIVDPAIYLFSTSGIGLFGNDNIDGSNTQAQLPAGFASSLTPGQYFLLIAPSGHLPEDKNNNSIFGAITGTTGVAGPAGGTLALKKYGGTSSADDAGKGYDITLTGAGFAVAPEPSAFVLVGCGLLACAGWRKRFGRKTDR